MVEFSPDIADTFRKVGGMSVLMGLLKFPEFRVASLRVVQKLTADPQHTVASDIVQVIESLQIQPDLRVKQELYTVMAKICYANASVKDAFREHGTNYKIFSLSYSRCVLRGLRCHDDQPNEPLWHHNHQHRTRLLVVLYCHRQCSSVLFHLR